MYPFLLVVHLLIALALVGVILMQQSEGGGLVGGGNPSGLMTARGAANFLTRTTTILACLFVALSIAMAAVATMNRSASTIDTSLARTPAQTAPAPAPVVPLADGTAPQSNTQPAGVPLPRQATPALDSGPAAQSEGRSSSPPQRQSPSAKRMTPPAAEKSIGVAPVAQPETKSDASQSTAIRIPDAPANPK